MTRAAALLLLWTAALPAHAGGSVSPSPFPDPPPVDAGLIPSTARQRPPMPDSGRHPVEARLLVREATVAPGSTFQLGIHLDQDDGWHTYWLAPGDIGLRTEVAWTLPPGFTVAPRTWPVPQRFEYEGIVSYGYDREVLHGFEVAVAPEVPAGTYPVEASVSWLVCQTSCIPGAATVSHAVVVAGETGPGPHADVFDHWRSRWPADDTAIDVRSAVCDPAGPGDGAFRVAFEVRGADGGPVAREGSATFPAFTPIPGHDDRMVDRVLVDDAGGVLRIGLDATTFAESSPAAVDPGIGGLLQVRAGGRDVRSEVLTPAPWGPAPTPDPAGPCQVFDRDTAEAAPPPAAAAFPDLPAAPTGAVAPTLLALNLAMALLGGLLLNIMPCVLPVLLIKLYGLVEQGGISPAQRQRAGVAYTFGILASFWALAGGVLVARAALGGGVGWGFQFQDPRYVAFLATVVFLFALNLFGVFEVPAPGGSRTDALQDREGLAGYFFTGVFATLVATPCSAPFLGTAIAFAFQASWGLLLLVFTAIGLGLAAPFLLVAFLPAAYRLLPRPGAWMESFKQFLGFTLIATAVWLVGVLGALVGHDSLTGFLAFLTVTGLAAWGLGRWGGIAASTGTKLRALAGAAALMAFGGWRFVDLTLLPPETCGPVGEIPADLDYDREIPWQDFSPERVAALEGRTLFLDFTADWCLTCKANEATVLASATVREAMAAHGVVPMQADWTRRDPVITDWLTRFGRAGVPMYVVVPPEGLAHATVLPEVITPGMVVDAVEAAAR